MNLLSSGQACNDRPRQKDEGKRQNQKSLCRRASAFEIVLATLPIAKQCQVPSAPQTLAMWTTRQVAGVLSSREAGATPVMALIASLNSKECNSLGSAHLLE